MSGQIDDPIDASFEAYPSEPEGLESTFSDLALSFSGLAFPPAAVLKLLKDQFLSSSRVKRIEYLLEGLRLGCKQIESEIGSDRHKMMALQTYIEGPRFQEAVATACEEAARASSSQQVRRFTAVLVGSLEPSSWADPKADLPAMIRDVAQLGDRDVEALDVLRTTFRSVIDQYPNLNDPNAFTMGMDGYRTAINLNGFDPEDFNACCARLAGFGLAIEVLRNISRMAPSDYCFRPTRRGLALLDYLDRFNSGQQQGTVGAAD